MLSSIDQSSMIPALFSTCHEAPPQAPEPSAPAPNPHTPVSVYHSILDRKGTERLQHLTEQYHSQHLRHAKALGIDYIMESFVFTFLGI